MTRLYRRVGAGRGGDSVGNIGFASDSFIGIMLSGHSWRYRGQYWARAHAGRHSAHNILERTGDGPVLWHWHAVWHPGGLIFAAYLCLAEIAQSNLTLTIARIRHEPKIRTNEGLTTQK